MKKTAKLLLCSLLCLAMAFAMVSSASAAKWRSTNSVEYLLPSDTQEITEEELWQWDRESLSFMFNEILARHGRQFESGGKMDNYFSGKAWYQAIPKVSNEKASDSLTDLEWKNYRTIKKVINDMNAVGHPYHKSANDDLFSWSDFASDGSYALTGFNYIKLKENQKLAVYSAPSYDAFRELDGRAAVSTNGAVWASGFDSGWLQIYYESNLGGLRVGYVDGKKISGKVDCSVFLNFAHTKIATVKDSVLTSDPLQQYAMMTSLPSGTEVSYLTTVVNQNGMSWDYIETTVDGKQARGYVPSGTIILPDENADIPLDTTEANG